MRLSPILNREYQILRQIFDCISYSIGAKLERNPTFDERGLTDELLDLLQTSLNGVKLSKDYINLSTTKPSEKKTGADILFRIIVNKPEISFDRYVLIQAKKYINGKFSETKKGNNHLSGQVKKMHGYNPEFSYIMLYSTNDNPIANAVVCQTNFQTILCCHSDFENIAFENRSVYLSTIQSCYPITLLRSKTWEKFKVINPNNLLSYSETFSNFILNDFITGKLGKEWDDEIEKAKGEFSFTITLTIGQE